MHFFGWCEQYRTSHQCDEELYALTIGRVWRSQLWKEVTEEHFPLWFGTALRHTRQERSRHRPLPQTRDQTPEEHRMLVRIGRLPEEDRTLVWDHIVAGVSLRQLARERHVPVSTLRYHYQKICQQLTAAG